MQITCHPIKQILKKIKKFKNKKHKHKTIVDINRVK